MAQPEPNRTDRSSPPIAALFAVLLAAVLFGTTGTAQELGPDGASPLGVGAVRVVIGAIGLLVATRFTRPAGAGPAGARPAGAGWRRHWSAIVLAGVGVAGYQIGFFEATDRAGVALGTLVALGSGPVFAGIHQSVRSRRAPSLGWTAATLLAVGGAGLVALGRGHDAGGDVGWGIAAALLAGLSYAVFSIANKHAIDGGMTSLAAMAASFAAGAVILSPLLVVEPMSWLMSGRGIAVAVHLGLAATSVAYSLFGFGLARLTVPTVVTLTLFEPATAAVLSVSALSQHLDVVGWVGVGLVVAGVAMVALVPAAGERSEPLAE